MRRSSLAVILVLAALFLVPSVVFSADYTYDEGDTVSLGFRSLPSGYTVYWTSDLDGYLDSGDTLTTDSLSAGVHTITYLLYRTSTGQLAYRGSVTVEIVAAAPQPSPSTGGGGAVAPGEFEEVQALLLGCSDAYSVDDLYPEFLDALRGVVETRIYVDNSYVRNDLTDLFVQTGVDDADYTFVTTPIDSIWIRDYGPLFVKDRGALQVVDLDYYPNRPNDDAVPARVARDFGATRLPLNVYWEGGNYTSNGDGTIFATDVLYAGNSISPSRIDSAVGAAFHARLEVLQHMENDGGTGHLDMFALWMGRDSLLLNRFPSGHRNYQIMNDNAARLQSLGYHLRRIDLADQGFSSYTNGVLINGVALVPTYGKSTTDQRALDAYRSAGYRPVGIDCRRIIQWSGAIHCIVNTVPR